MSDAHTYVQLFTVTLSHAAVYQSIFLLVYLANYSKTCEIFSFCRSLLNFSFMCLHEYNGVKSKDWVLSGPLPCPPHPITSCFIQQTYWLILITAEPRNFGRMPLSKLCSLQWERSEKLQITVLIFDKVCHKNQSR